MRKLTNHQCYCYGIIAIYNILNNRYPLTSDLFYNELYYLWDIYTEEAIEQLYTKMEEKGKIKKLENIGEKDW